MPSASFSCPLYSLSEIQLIQTSSSESESLGSASHLSLYIIISHPFLCLSQGPSELLTKARYGIYYPSLSAVLFLLHSLCLTLCPSLTPLSICQDQFASWLVSEFDPLPGYLMSYYLTYMMTHVSLTSYTLLTSPASGGCAQH